MKIELLLPKQISEKDINPGPCLSAEDLHVVLKRMDNMRSLTSELRIANTKKLSNQEFIQERKVCAYQRIEKVHNGLCSNNFSRNTYEGPIL